MTENSHRANVLVTSCLKTPVDPQTKTPVALYERERSAEVHAQRHDEEQKEDDSRDESDSGADAGQSKGLAPLPPDPREFCISKLEYYHKLEQLRSAYLQTMAELDLMYHQKLDLQEHSALGSTARARRMDWDDPNLMIEVHKAHSVILDPENEKIIEGDGSPIHLHPGAEKSLNEHIRNMWKDFTVDESSSQNQKHDRQTRKKPTAHVQRPKKTRRAQVDGWQPQVTVPKPFLMTLRDAETKHKGRRCRSEIERENEELRKQLEELTECQRKFRASPVPAHVHLPLYEELLERDEERRRQVRAAEQQGPRPRPFSFLEREQAKKEQKEAVLQERKEQEKHGRSPFRAKPVPRAVKEAASGERQKEEQLYREIKKQMRATEMLLSASTPPSMLAKRLAERRLRRADQAAADGLRQPKTNSQVPDFDASYRRFKEQLESKREFRPATACEPFNLSTASTASRKARDEVQPRSPRTPRWQFVASTPQTPSSSICSSLSGSLEYLPSKITDAAKKRQEAVRNILEQRKKAEEEEERWKNKQKQKERKLQKLIARRAQANDPHVTLAQACQAKLKEFRKQDLQRLKEYREEMREIQERVKSRPLLLEQVAQMNAKRAAERHYAEALHGCGLSEAFVNSKAPSLTSPNCSERRPSSGSRVSRDSQRVIDQDVDDLVNRNDPEAAETELDYPADYEDYEPDIEDQTVDSENESQEEKEDPESGPHKELDDHPHEDDPNFADSDGDGDKSDGSNTSGEGDDVERPLRDEERTENEKSRRSSQASSSGKEAEGKEESDEDD